MAAAGIDFPPWMQGWTALRQLALSILLTAFLALVLHAPAKVGAGPDAIHENHAVMTGRSVGDNTKQLADSALDCTSDSGSICCPASLAVVPPAGPQSVALQQAGESSRPESPVLRARIPDLHARENAETAAAKGEGRGESLRQKLVGIVHDPRALFTPAPVFSFPDIVGSEALALLEGLKALGSVGQLDPKIQSAIEAGQGKAGRAAVAGGSWLLFAGVVQMSVFAPYILAAQISAFIPFVGGSTVVSLLAVMVNPVTLVAGLGALGYFGVKGKADQVRRMAAARVAAILSLRGMGQEAKGVAKLVSDFRRLADPGSVALLHLSEDERASIEQRIGRIKQRLLGRLGLYGSVREAVVALRFTFSARSLVCIRTSGCAAALQCEDQLGHR